MYVSRLNNRSGLGVIPMAPRMSALDKARFLFRQRQTIGPGTILTTTPQPVIAVKPLISSVITSARMPALERARFLWQQKQKVLQEVASRRLYRVPTTQIEPIPVNVVSPTSTPAPGPPPIVSDAPVEATQMPTFIDVATAEMNPMLKWGLLAVGAYIFFASAAKEKKRMRRRRSTRRRRR